MKTYRVEMMTKEHYINYLSGGNNYYVDVVEVKAENKEEAIATAKNNYANYVINEKNVKTVEEFENEKLEQQEKWARKEKELADRKAKAKERKEERDLAKAIKMGVTIEEYKAMVKREKKIRAIKKEIAELEIALANAKKRLAKI